MENNLWPRKIDARKNFVSAATKVNIPLTTNFTLIVVNSPTQNYPSCQLTREERENMWSALFVRRDLQPNISLPT